MLALRFPGEPTSIYSALGLPKYAPDRGIDVWHMHAFWFIVFALVAALVGRRDRWLGCAVVTLGLGMFLWAGSFDVTHRIVFLVGALALWAVRQTPKVWHPMARDLLAASGVFQAVYMLQQYLGYDVLWGPMVGGILKPQLQPIGTLGTVDAASAYVAIAAPLMPVWALPIALAVVLKGHSIGAICSLAVGLLIRYHRSWPLTGFITTSLVIAWWGYMYHFAVPHIPTTVSGRITIWQFALADWWERAAIFGPGPWAQQIPQQQMRVNLRPNDEFWVEAHNEYLQWLYEYGALGASIAGLWLWSHRRMFRDAMCGASLAALAVVSGSFFTFHVVSVALLGLCLVGLATAHTHDHLQEVA